MLTQEQQKIVGCDLDNGKLKLVQAFAGTGKTTTLQALAKRHKDKNILYLSFNKSLVENNNFELNVDANTIHGLAYKEFENKPKFIQGKLSIQKICNILNVNSSDSDTILRILNNFCSSINTSIKMKHVYSIDNSGLKNPKFYLVKVQELWKKLESFEVEVPHDAYLKMYMLKNIELKYDIILVDEIQDITPCILKILLRNNIPKVFVGDIHQQIYGFRNVIDPFEICKICEHFELTKSFRYGGDILHVVNNFLQRFKYEKSNIEGTQCTKVHYINPFKKNYTYICRTNKQLLNYALLLAKNDIHFKILLKNMNWRKESSIYDMLKTLKENGIVHEYLSEKFNISSYDEAKTLFQECKNFKWLHRMAILEEGHNIYDILEEFHSESAEIRLITCHMSKGLEFDNVVMGNDFSKVVFKNNLVCNYDNDSYNLIYVCMTRAKQNLVLNYDVLNFLRKCNPSYFKHNITENMHPCIKCGELSKNIISHNVQRLPYYISKINEIKITVCDECCVEYKKETIKTLH